MVNKSFLMLIMIMFISSCGDSKETVIIETQPDINHSYSPLDYGAIGDRIGKNINSEDIASNPQWIGSYEVGDTWDYVGIQEAVYNTINSDINSDSSKTVFINSGNYIINKDIKITDRISIEGEGITSTNIYVSGDGGITITGEPVYTQGYSISNLRLIPMRENIDYGIKILSSSNTSVVSVDIDNVKIDSHLENFFTTGIIIDAIRKLKIDNVNVRANSNGLYITNDTAEVNIVNSYFMHSGPRIDESIGINITSDYKHTEGIIMENNLIFAFHNGIQMSNSLASKILNNYIDHVHTDSKAGSNGIVLYDNLSANVSGNWILSFETGIKMAGLPGPKPLSNIINTNHIDFSDYAIDVYKNNQSNLISNNVVPNSVIGFRFQTNVSHNLVTGNYINSSVLELDFGYGAIKNKVTSNYLTNNYTRFIETDNEYNP